MLTAVSIYYYYCLLLFVTIITIISEGCISHQDSRILIQHKTQAKLFGSFFDRLRNLRALTPSAFNSVLIDFFSPSLIESLDGFTL